MKGETSQLAERVRRLEAALGGITEALQEMKQALPMLQQAEAGVRAAMELGEALRRIRLDGLVTSRVTVLNPAGRPAVVLGVDDVGRGCVGIGDGDQVGVSIWMDAQGGSFGLRGTDGESKLVAMPEEGGYRVSLANADGDARSYTFGSGR